MDTAMPVRMLPQMDLDEFSVTDSSYWTDKVWRFPNPTAGQDPNASAIHWDFSMPDRSKFTDKKWSDLRKSFKMLAYSLMYDTHNGKQYKSAMAGEISFQIRYFARWMAIAGYADFGELDAPAFEEFVEYVRADRCRRDDAPSHGHAKVSARQLLRFLQMPTLLAAQASVLKEASIPTPTAVPWGGMTATAKARELAAVIEIEKPAMPDDVFVKAMSEAISILSDADSIIAEIDAFRENRSDFSNRQKGGAMSARLRVKSDELRNACLTVIQGLTGMRVSEVCGLETNPNRCGEWPSCIEMRPSSSGINEIFYIEGMLYKMEDSWTEAEWVVGSRPVGSSSLPIPVRAVVALDRLFRPERIAAKIEKLCVGYHSAEGVTRESGAVGRISSLDIRRVNFCLRSHFERCGIENWEVSSHQWRKTFAHYVISVDVLMLPALRDHFKHLSIAMTETGYLSDDLEMQLLKRDAALQNTIRIVGELLSGRAKIVGPLAEGLKERVGGLGARLGNRSESDRAEDIEDIVRSSGIRAWPILTGASSAGTCLFRQGTGKCTEGCGARWVLSAPLWSAATPDLCWECENLVLEESHAEFWKDRLSSLRADLAAAKAGNEVGLEFLCRTRIAQCLSVLARMGVKLEMPMEDDDAG